MAYRASLHFFFARPVLGILLAMVLPVTGFWAGTQLEEQFFPPAERDQFELQITLPASASIAKTTERAQEIRERLLMHEEVERVHWFVGRGSPKFYYNLLGGRENSPMFAQALVQLRSSEGALALINQLQLRARHGLSRHSGHLQAARAGAALRRPGRDPDLRAGPRAAPALWRRGPRRAGGYPGGHAHQGQPCRRAAQARGRAASGRSELAGLDKVQIARQMQLGLEGRLGGSMLEATEELPVRVRLDDRNREDAQGIASLELIGEAGRTTPLSALGRLTLLPETANIPRFQTERCNTVQGFLLAGELPSAYVAEFERRWAERGLALRPGYHLGFGGETEARNEAVGNLLASVGLLMTLDRGDARLVLQELPARRA